MRVSCIQLAVRDAESKTERVRRALDLIGDAASDADLVTLPELWPTGYFHFDRYESEAEGLDGPTVAALADVAAYHRVHLAGGSFVERTAGGLSNTAVVFDPAGTLVHTYRKVHLFGHDSREAELLTPGDEVGVVRTDLGVLGSSTCYDLRFPELYRVLVERGAEIVVVPAAWPTARLEHWRLLTRARALENQVVVIATNGAGTHAGVSLAGHSLAVDPTGEVRAEAGEGEEILRVEVDVEAVARARAEFPVLTQRRIGVGVVRPQPDQA